MSWPARRRLPALCAALAGLAGAMDEVLWSRRLSGVLGHEAGAFAAFSAAFLIGLAAGGLACDRLERRFPGRRLRLFAAAQAGLALLAWRGGGWLDWLGRGTLSGVSPAFGLLLAALGPGAFVLGLSLPLLSAPASDGAGEAAGLGSVFGWSALGAALGCLLGGVLLPPWLGLSRCGLAASAASAAAAAAATAGQQPAADLPAPAGALPPVIAILAFLAGATLMACQVAWLRLLQLLLGPTVQAIGVVLAVVWLGLGAGALLYRRARARMACDARGWAWLQLCLAAWLLASLFVLQHSFPWAAVLLSDSQRPFAARLLLDAAFVAAGVFPACLIMGLDAPWLMGCAEAQGASSGGGIFCLAAGAGGALGAVLAAFRLLPAWSMEGTLRAAALLSAGCAGAVGLRHIRSWAKDGHSVWAAVALAAAALYLPPALEPAELASAPYLYGQTFALAHGLPDFLRLARAQRPIFYADGLRSTVTVKQAPDGRSMQIDGRTEDSSADDLIRLVAGYVPLMLDPAAERVLVAGLGSGMTAAALAQSPRLLGLKIVEPEPRAVEAAELFGVDNGGLLSQPRVDVVFQDARSFLRVDRDLYDVIEVRPPPPWQAGAAVLYSRESLQDAALRLAPHGIYAQWLPAYQMSRDDFRSALNTFASVFPHVLLFRAGTTYDYLMLGCNDGWSGAVSEQADALVRQTPSLKTALARLHLEASPGAGQGLPFELLAGEFVLGDGAFRRYASGAPLDVEDRPVLELSAPRHLFAGEEKSVYESLEAAREEEFPAELMPDKASLAPGTIESVTGAASLALQDYPRALRLLDAAIRSAPGDLGPKVLYARALVHVRRLGEAEKLLLGLAADNPRLASLCFHLADLYVMKGSPKKAMSWLERGLRIAPDDPRGNLSAGSLYLEYGKKEAARRAFARGLKARPLDETTRRLLETSLAQLR